MYLGLDSRAQVPCTCTSRTLSLVVVTVDSLLWCAKVVFVAVLVAIDRRCGVHRIPSL
jgi:hypothetical protein